VKDCELQNGQQEELLLDDLPEEQVSLF